MMEKPTLRQLEYFVAVAEERHFGRAARRCFVTQPALSGQLRLLETQLGTSLFERGRSGVFPTPAAEALLPLAKRILSEVDTFLETAQAARDPLGGDLRLGVIPTIAPYLLPDVLPHVRRRLPRLRLWLREDLTPRLVADCKSGRLDLLLLALEADLEDLETITLARDPFFLLVREDHPLAGRKRVALEQLESEEVLLLEDGHCLRDQVLALCDRAELKEIGDFRASSLPTLVQMVAGGAGVTLLPSLAVGREVRRRDRLVTVPFKKPEPYRTIGLAFRRGTHRRELFEKLAALLRPRIPL